MAKRVKYEGSFNAADEKGEVYLIDIFSDILHVGTDEEIPGLKSLTIRGGRQHVNYLEKGKYEILMPRRNVLVTSDDPIAP